ncbi:hypothetical protein [Methylotuvimicrobium alcaliphilum]|uniref:Lipoprotein n=1 Tax=Methylotuvimicrobium alcaliphilum (strain DSM 19304 / NCIMB 14124 / VKM B-2133 / 20Z) TaxID=1091494 RepID=G4T2J1_META2|nr:hypothetical protein [Methylotuvimicrobium alcaliphilum]CCE24720.1 conserved protein of unknown function [Methylotuvimicrobium alcaliphilum 20Z]
MPESILNTALSPNTNNSHDFDYRALLTRFGKPRRNRIDSIMTGIFILLLPLVLSGCQAPPIKAPAYKTAQLRQILVVPIETPPLEVIPDPIDNRLPVQRHFRNMEIATPLTKKIYLNPGKLLVSGLISNEDVVTEFAPDIEQDAHRPSLSPLGQDYWLPSQALAENLVTQLTFNNIKSQLSSHYYRLPSPTARFSSDPADWRKSVAQWYEQTQSSIDYRSLKESAGFDAVLEIGIGHYRIFEGQTALQILMRLVDPADGTVYARTSAETYTVSGSSQSLLGNEGQRFKQLITDMGMRLVDRGLGNIGLPLRKTALNPSKIPFVEAPPVNTQF